MKRISVSRNPIEGREKFLTLRKYKSSTVLFRSMVPARNISTIQTRTAMVRRKGAVIQHIRPAETMIATASNQKVLLNRLQYQTSSSSAQLEVSGIWCCSDFL